MKLTELAIINEEMDEGRAFQTILKSFDDWVQGNQNHSLFRGPSSDFSPAIMTLIKRFMSNAVYVGQVYRFMKMPTHVILKATSAAQLMQYVKNFNHSNKTGYLAWSRTTEGIEQLFSHDPGDENGTFADSVSVNLIVTQHTDFGISVEEVYKTLKSVGLEPKIMARGAIITEVIAPYDPSITPFEFQVEHAGRDKLYDPTEFGDVDDEDSYERDLHKQDVTVFRPGEFDRMKQFIEKSMKRSPGSKGPVKTKFYNDHPLRQPRINPWDQDDDAASS